MTASRKGLHSSYADFSDDDAEPATLTEEVAANLNDLLTQKQIPFLSSREQFHLADIVECIGTVEKHRRSIDDNAGRFLLFFRQHALRDDHAISWREIAWAFHSSSQDILIDLVSRHYNGRMLWQHAKESGMFMWLNDTNAIVSPEYERSTTNILTLSSEPNSKVSRGTHTPLPTQKTLSPAPSTTLPSARSQCSSVSGAWPPGPASRLPHSAC
jgi:hypothetical protein